MNEALGTICRKSNQVLELQLSLSENIFLQRWNGY